MALTLKELAQEIDAQVVGDADLTVDSVATLEDARPGQISFLSNARYARQLETTRASAVIVGPGVIQPRLTLLRARDPYFAFAQTVMRLHGLRKHPYEGIHPRAHVEPGAQIGEGTIVYPGVYIGRGVRIGRDCVLHPNVAIYEDCALGDRVIVHANSTIGQDGFGYATHDGIHHKMPQIGNVVIEDDVEIGANCCIARAALGSTVIGRGSKLDALIAIGHNVKLGPHAIIVAHVGIAGSSTLGHHATLAGQVGVAGHLHLGDNVTIGAQAGVVNDVPDQSTMLGSPAMPIRQARRVAAVFVQLPQLNDRVKKLEQLVQELSMSGSGEENVSSSRQSKPETPKP